jgi:3-methyladenine DNA glycosylase AlkC
MTKAKATGRGVKDITAQRLAQLNSGAEARTLTECLAVDFAALMSQVFPKMGDEILAQMRQAASLGISRRMSVAARLIEKRIGLSAMETLAQHSSDTARGWGCFIIGAVEKMDLAQRLDAIRRYADDAHFGVREWAWLAVRPHLAAELEQAIARLADWTLDSSERIRRFASESIRPRGVWCTHIAALRQKPELALAVLEALRADPSSYVQDSVGNWLNDASKDQPAWVKSLCARWSSESPTLATARICRRALRSQQ